ncbi:MAG TPA: tetratricopeptide repeat protein [Trueperaceae bacterium]|nr:tetratricopeptide repeat protein [Trueperaceae bacterium]
MHRPARRFLLLILAAFTAIIAPVGVVSAASLAVHPFASDDPLLGMAVADELAASFEGVDVLLGPDVTAGAIPPLMVPGGFIGITRVVGEDPMHGPAGAQLLRGALGVDVAATGSVLVLDASYRLDLVVAGPEGVVSASLQAPHGRRDQLVAQAARVVARALNGPTPAPPSAPALDGAYANYVTALVYAGDGFVSDAASLLASVAATELPVRAHSLLEDLDAAIAPASAAPVASASRQLRRALLGLGVESFDEDTGFAAFQAVTAGAQLPLAGAWAAVLAASVGDYAAATASLEAANASGSYPYGEALAAALAWAQGDEAAAVAAIDDVIASPASGRAAALLGASIVAQIRADPQRETAALNALSRVAPHLVYSFERLSYLAFDRDDPLAAAEALIPAVQLEPESDLYWTNLGWSYYLLGFLDKSEEASQRAVELDGNQYIALYNLGLVGSVQGRLADAVKAYDRAIKLDPAVDDEAIADLESALELYPSAVGVNYSLAYLYDAEGRRDDARARYRRFVRLATAAGEYPEFVALAADRLVVLDAPPPPLELSGGVTPKLGVRGPDASPFHPGDRVFPAFEVSTPGDQLPARLNVTITITGASEESVATGGGEVVVPTGAVGFVVDTLALDLPLDLAAGAYDLNVEVSALDGSRTAGSATLEVDGAPEVLRQLFSRGVVMTALESGAPLYGAKDLADPQAFVAALVDELRSGAAAADQALPTVDSGRFAGQTGRELFESSTDADVIDYLAYVIAGGVSDFRFVFVDGYASWALDGAPTAPEGAAE